MQMTQNPIPGPSRKIPQCLASVFIPIMSVLQKLKHLPLLVHLTLPGCIINYDSDIDSPCVLLLYFMV